MSIFHRLKICTHIHVFSGVALLGFALILLTLFLPGGSATARVEKKLMMMLDGTEIKYSVVMPDGYDGDKALPTILALPGGDQQSQQVAWGLENYWQAEAEARGYLVISPQSPGHTFIEGTAVYIPEFLERIKIHFKVKNDRFHLVGIGVGGLSAFQVAAFNPDYFSSLLSVPGYVWAPNEEKYQALRDICIIQIAGAPEVKWADAARRDQDKFREMGMNPYLEILPGKVHWKGACLDDRATELFDMIENKVGC